MEKQWNARLFLLNFFANNEQITNKFFRKVQFFKSSTRTLVLSSAEGDYPGPLPGPPPPPPTRTGRSYSYGTDAVEESTRRPGHYMTSVL